MATKITTALVAALLVGALMTPNHEHSRAAAAGLAEEVMKVVSAAEGSMDVVSAAVDSTEVVSTVMDSGSKEDSDAATDLDAASDMDVASDFMVAILLLWRVWVWLQSVFLRLLRMLLSSTARCSNGGRSRRRTSAWSHTR